jgi:hypothetical protein
MGGGEDCINRLGWDELPGADDAFTYRTGGVNAFKRDTGEWLPTEIGLYCIGGMIEHLPALTAIGSPDHRSPKKRGTMKCPNQKKPSKMALTPRTYNPIPSGTAFRRRGSFCLTLVSTLTEMRHAIVLMTISISRTQIVMPSMLTALAPSTGPAMIGLTSMRNCQMQLANVNVAA